MSTVKLTVNPESFQFDNKELADLRAILKESDKHTMVMPVGALTDLCLTEDGTTHRGYSYTGAALVQLCGLVAPGLAQLVLDLSGQWRKPAEDPRAFSANLAIETLNRAIKLRFDRKLLGLQMIRNTKIKTIDGIVGSKYRYLANSDFLDRVDLECTAYKSNYQEACLYGRQFIVRYRNQQQQLPQYKIAGEMYNFGYHFANSEIGGKSVRATSILVRESGDSALCPYNTAARVVHSGRDFEKRLHGLMGQIFQRLPPHHEIEEDGVALDEKSLRLGGEGHDKQVRHIMQVLTRRKLTQNFARRVISSTAALGRSGEDNVTDALPSDREKILASRTGYDLFAALIREARKLPIDQRETAEQVAYSLLTGKISI